MKSAFTWNNQDLITEQPKSEFQRRGRSLRKAEIKRFISRVQIRSPQARTWRDYRCDLDLFVNVVAKHNREEIRPHNIDDFVNFQVDQGYKPSTINRRLAAIPEHVGKALQTVGMSDVLQPYRSVEEAIASF